jgi:outer membrane lipoprotein-sorting protein
VIPVRRQVFLVLTVLCLFMLSAGVACGEPLRSVRADFTQEKHMKILIKPLVSKGVLAYAAPDRLRWEYRFPIRSVLLADSGRMQKFVEHDGKLTRDQGGGFGSMQIILQEIRNWLAGRFTENPLFAVSRPDDRRVVLTPKEEGLRNIINRIELRFGAQQLLMESVTIYENGDSYTTLNFTNGELNKPIPENYFQQP